MMWTGTVLFAGGAEGVIKEKLLAWTGPVSTLVFTEEQAVSATVVAANNARSG
jgi:hypothetical protein